MTQTLNQKLAALHEERVRTWKPEDLAANIGQRRELVESFDPATVVQVGDRLDGFELLDTEGGTLTLDALVSDGPAVLIFFRFAGCPACNIALPHYRDALWPALQEAGVRLVAISPQVPGPLGEIGRRHALGFTVASDPDNRLGRRFGITFESNAASKAYALSKGSNLPETIGTGSWELPQPTAILIDRDHVVRFVDVSPDWLVRTEPDAILAAVAALDSAEAVAA